MKSVANRRVDKLSFSSGLIQSTVWSEESSKNYLSLSKISSKENTIIIIKKLKEILEMKLFEVKIQDNFIGKWKHYYIFGFKIYTRFICLYAYK